MYAPHRLLAVMRVSTQTGLVLATAVATATFIATPLVLAPVAELFGISTGTAALFAAAQLAMFVGGSWTAGRFVQPSGRLFVQVLVLLAVANVISGFAPEFWWLVIARAGAGLALGVLTWLAYSQVFGDSEGTSDIAVVGPVTGVVIAPLFGLVLQVSQVQTVFFVLAALALIPLARVPSFATLPARAGGRNQAVRPALVLIAALGVVTLGGSAVFVFAGAIAAQKYGMGPVAVSLAFSANAAAGIPSARWRGGRPGAGWWLLIATASAIGIGTFDQAPLFWLILTAWGFAFWLAIPATFNLLSERSRFPAERAGDAQAAMAAGRAVGPLMGGAAVAAGSFQTLGIVGGVVIAVGALMIVAVEQTTSPVEHPG